MKTFPKLGLALGLWTVTCGLALASSSVAGRVDAPAPVVGGPTIGNPTCSYSNNPAGNAAAGSCSTSVTYPNAYSATGLVTSSVDAAGLHARAEQSAFLIGAFASNLPQFPIAFNATADAQFRDTLAFLDGAPALGTVRIGFSAEGANFEGGNASAEFVVTDLFGARSASSCFIANSGNCFVSQTIHFGTGFQLDESLDVFAHAVLGNSVTSSADSISDFRNTAGVTSIQFFDVDGAPLSLTYTTASGYRYPQFVVSSVPEPEVFAMLAGGLLLIGLRRKQRRDAGC